jgi:hypothetical protein
VAQQTADASTTDGSNPGSSSRIAFRLVDASPERRYAGAVAALGVLGIRDYTHFYLSAQSDPMIVALCLGAVDCYLCGRLRWSFLLWVLGALGRPEVWPFLGLYTVWLWRRDPAQRRMIIAGTVAIPLLWFGIPGLTARSPFVAGDNALGSVSALHGWPAILRYLFDPAAIACVLAGVAVGPMILDLPPLLKRMAPRVSPSVIGPATGILVVVFLATWVPGARSRLRLEKANLVHERARTRELNRLAAVITRLGGIDRIWACGRPNLPVDYQSAFAWLTDRDIGALHMSTKVVQQAQPIVTFHPLHDGWAIVPSHLTTAAQRAACHGVRMTYRS